MTVDVFIPIQITHVSIAQLLYMVKFAVFQDVHLMIFVGFGFLMAFLKVWLPFFYKNSSRNTDSQQFLLIFYSPPLSSNGQCFYEDLCQNSFKRKASLASEFPSKPFSASSDDFWLRMMCADCSCACCLITMGVLLGKMTPAQFLLLAFCETTISVLVEHVIFNIFHVNDGGRSMAVHMFGAYFGLAASMVGHKKNVMEMNEQGSINHSDLFSMIGTLLLWVFFPSFNAAVQEPGISPWPMRPPCLQRMRAIEPLWTRTWLWPVGLLPPSCCPPGTII